MEEKKIKVTDKRMFTPDGELREDFRDSKGEPPAADAAREPDPGPETSRARVSAGPPTESEPSAASTESRSSQEFEMPELGPDARKPEFADLVAVLAQPIAMYLGDMPLPSGESAENLDAARLYIDLLDVLRDKSRNNLTPEESQLLEDLLYQTRLRYVQKRG